jgi:hypothetical protein
MAGIKLFVLSVNDVPEVGFFSAENAKDYGELIKEQNPQLSVKISQIKLIKLPPKPKGEVNEPIELP